eukprot:scaffold1959_cov403-Prasinococcus_capsulatus_cf.AAC.4
MAPPVQLIPGPYGLYPMQMVDIDWAAAHHHAQLDLTVDTERHLIPLPDQTMEWWSWRPGCCAPCP